MAYNRWASEVVVHKTLKQSLLFFSDSILLCSVKKVNKNFDTNLPPDRFMGLSKQGQNLVIAKCRTSEY